MWIVTKIADLVQLKPQDFYKTSLEAIEDKINEKYANKVIPNIGLCVCVWDITDASEGLIGQYDGFVNINVEFHMVVFRPHRGEVIQARIKEQTSQGMRQPARVALVTNRRHSVEAEKVWLWKSDEETQLYYDTHEIVRFMVLEERWYTQPPTKPKESTDSDAPTKTTYQAPYSIIGTMAAPGLGITLWWE
ncbi:DNA-directed RNA polymerase III complex subunit Rpc25 [Podospora pseudopauciseta]|uniref:DNA-directed RNA polymerase subunit n=3 Tax=Podospora TaxID=5144 RepID=A0ABR0I1K5_9PEZI|nr:DNA-directed RNA polymerase III complex subunit Rpc25 [Podospora bellae-mahoneyi]KAK4674014.1 DNA-directed RNA polymerase III complex subunit Rpc25 [Podospora pseudopauciseta]KAK4682513.1 DNA-directed RNA polymerase III complex subunit Rpc25 [Podospora pseudoanserina]